MLYIICLFLLCFQNCKIVVCRLDSSEHKKNLFVLFFFVSCQEVGNKRGCALSTDLVFQINEKYHDITTHTYANHDLIWLGIYFELFFVGLVILFDDLFVYAQENTVQYIREWLRASSKPKAVAKQPIYCVIDKMHHPYKCYHFDGNCQPI